MDYLPLRAYRRSRGWSQEKLAERLMLLAHEIGERPVGTTGATVGRWERGERSPRPPYPHLLCVLFETSAVELGLAPSPYLLPDVTLEGMERRTLLRLLRGTLAVPALACGRFTEAEAAAGPLGHALRKPSRADEAVVAAVEDGIAATRRLDDVSGSRVAVRPALAWREVVRTLLAGGPPAAVSGPLTGAAAELSQLLGWLAFEMNDHHTSRGYFNESLQLAREAGAENLEAYVLAYLSIVHVAGDDPRQGLELAETARGRAETRGSFATLSFLAMAEAEALAELGDRAGAERTLDHARTALARSRAEDRSQWLYYWDTGNLEGWAGDVYLDLGLAAPARQAMKQAVATLDASMVRQRAHDLVRLGQTYALEAEADEACRLAGEALTIAAATRSDRAVLRVRKLRSELKPWESEPMVRDLDDQLAAASAWSQQVVV